MKVKRWISLKQAEEYKESVGWVGGWFSNGHRWKDYIEDYKEPISLYLEAIRQSVLENCLRLTGEQHQYSINGIPLFEDDTVGIFTFRAWGDLMAAIWSEAENKNYSYIDFYM